MSLFKFIDWFIPPELRQKPEQHLRARVLISGVLFMISVALIVRLVRVSAAQGAPLSKIALPVILLGLSTPFILKWTGRLRLAGAIPILVLMAVLPFAVSQTGGPAAPAIPLAAALVPTLGTLLLGVRLGIVCTGILIAELVTIALLYKQGFSFDQRIDPDKMYIFQITIASVTALVISFLTWSYERARLAAEDKLRAEIRERRLAERAKDDFVATVSHELRTPLTAIRGAIELLENGVYGRFEQPVGDLLEITARNARSLSLLVDDLLDIRAIEEGKLSMKHSRLQLSSVVREAVTTNRALAESHSTEFCLRVTDDELYVSGDRRRLHQVMTNLLSNAAKFTQPGTSIEVAVERSGCDARISVSDRGAGIPANFQERVFTRFAQADTSTTRQHAGTGLGLHITRALIEAHGGSIYFETQEGVGTTFFVDLPIFARAGDSPT